MELRLASTAKHNKLTMLDSVLYDLGKALATLAADKLKEEYTLLVGVREEGKKLQKKLNMIKPMLADAEQRALMEEKVKCWFDDLKDVVYDIEDVLYDWTMEVDRNEGKPKHDETAAGSDQKENKVCFSSCIPTSCSCFKPIKKVQNRHDIARRIEAINLRLDEINQLKNDYKFESRREIDQSLIPRVLTTSFGEVKDLHAQTIIKQKVIETLLQPAQGTDGGRKIQVISLVGMGGIGKTTIAKIVYNDADVKSHFDKLMWVCVSDPFSQMIVSKEILNSLRGNKDRVTMTRFASQSGYWTSRMMLAARSFRTSSSTAAFTSGPNFLRFCLIGLKLGSMLRECSITLLSIPVMSSGE
ncbi:hypothetical protein Dimus_027579 [Dionaea muscipula]